MALPVLRLLWAGWSSGGNDTFFSQWRLHDARRGGGGVQLKGGHGICIACRQGLDALLPVLLLLCLLCFCYRFCRKSRSSRRCWLETPLSTRSCEYHTHHDMQQGGAVHVTETCRTASHGTLIISSNHGLMSFLLLPAAAAPNQDTLC
jgi:hypothetical protein